MRNAVSVIIRSEESFHAPNCSAGSSFYSSCGFVGSFSSELVSFVLCGYSLIDLAARETLGPLTQHVCAQLICFE